MQSEQHVINVIEGRHGPGRSSDDVDELTENNCREWKLSTAYPKKGTYRDQM